MCCDLRYVLIVLCWGMGFTGVDYSSASAGYHLLGIYEFGYFLCFICVRCSPGQPGWQGGASMYGEGGTGAAQVAVGVYILLL